MKRIYICLILSVFAVIVPGFGQTAQFLTVSPDSYSLSLGGTGVISPANAFAIYNNNAATALSPFKGAFAASYTMWQPTTTDNQLMSLSGFIKMGKRSAISLGSRLFLYPAYDLSNPQGSVTGAFSPRELSVDLGYAYNISGSFSASATVHYISSKLGTEAAGSAYAADLGLMYQPGNFSLGLTATNLGSKIDYGYGPYTLPAQIKLGAGYHFSLQEKHLLTAAVQAGYLIVNSGITAGIGLEYSYNNLISLRVGGHYGNPEKGIPSHLSAGLGFNFKGLTLNAAYLLAQKDSPLANSLSVGLGWAF
ncbi:MAG: PorV/PorQ family protein [Bacteroidales bacterium]